MLATWKNYWINSLDQDFFLSQFSIFTCLVLEIANELSLESFVITEPAPVVTDSPRFIGATKTVFAPILEFLPIFVWCFFFPSKLAVIVPAPIFVELPIIESPI